MVFLYGFARSCCHRDRHTFITIVHSILRDSPRRFFELYFMYAFTLLANDPVRSVRLAWAKVVRFHVKKNGALTTNRVVW